MTGSHGKTLDLCARNTQKSIPSAERASGIRYQLDGQRRKAASMGAAQQPSNRHLLSCALWKLINGISPVIFNTFITMEATVEGTCATNVSYLINDVSKECSFVFSNALTARRAELFHRPTCKEVGSMATSNVYGDEHAPSRLQHRESI